MHKLVCAGAMALAVGGCHRAAPSAPPPTTHEEAKTEATVPLPRTGPDAKTPLAPVKLPIDPKSSQAAEELVRGFARLLNEGKLDEAYMLLGPGAPPRAAFDRDFARFPARSVRVGRAGGQEGAAGSIYMSVPLTVSGTADGKRVTRSADVVVRRVNDVPGSTEAQRRWHIERIDWKA